MTEPTQVARGNSNLYSSLLAHWSCVLGLCLDQTQRAVDDMLQALAQLASQPELKAEVVGLLGRLNEGLQYQDRQRQMLELLQADMHAADNLSAVQVAELDIEAWKTRFEEHCPIPELRSNSLGAGHRAGPDLEFF